MPAGDAFQKCSYATAAPRMSEFLALHKGCTPACSLALDSARLKKKKSHRRKKRSEYIARVSRTQRRRDRGVSTPTTSRAVYYFPIGEPGLSAVAFIIRRFTPPLARPRLLQHGSSGRISLESISSRISSAFGVRCPRLKYPENSAVAEPLVSSSKISFRVLRLSAF